MSALNTSEGQRGGIRVMVQTAEAKRETNNYLVAFLSDEPRLKRMVRKVAPDAFHLHGGVVITVEMNSARLAQNTLATIILDPSADEAIATIWQDIGETPEQAAIRRGYPSQCRLNLIQTGGKAHLGMSNRH